MANNEELSELKKFVNLVQDYVEKNRHAFIVPEHMFLILLDDDKVKKMLTELTTDENSEEVADVLKKDVSLFLEKNIERTQSITSIAPTNSYTKMLQGTVTQSAIRSIEPNSLSIFLSLFNDDNSTPKYFLAIHGITEDNAQEYVRKHRMNGYKEKTGSGVDSFSVELVTLAKDGKIDPMIGRSNEVDRVIQIMAKKRCRNPILVGEPGVGKTAVVEGLALKIANGEVPDSMKSKKIHAISLASMVAGTKYRGEFEKRLQDTLDEVTEDKDAILFIDELHTVCGAGTGADGTLDASNILKPYLSSGDLCCIGATTYDEYKNNILKNKAFARRFKKIDIGEPSKDETLGILKGLRSSYEKYHGVEFSDEVLKYIVSLSDRYIFDKFFPDKAIDVMDEIGAKHHSGLEKKKDVDKNDVETVIANMANIPKVTAEVDDCEKLKNLGDVIKKNLYGQDEIVDKIVRQVRMSKAGLANVGKPLTIMGIGQTGCGKTELAKQLASALGINFVKLDMSEYSEEYSTSKLIGSAAGYVGYDQPGALTEPLIKTPHCVLLLDEIEKANKTVYNLLLQVIDEGKLTDNHGREASFRNAIVMMTSNVGCASADSASKPFGFSVTDEDHEEKKSTMLEQAFKTNFSPEFRNRLTDVFYFNPLDKQSILLIVDKNIRRINDALTERKVTVTISDSAKEYFAEKALAENAGGRPVERIINAEVAEKMADEILFGKLKNGGAVKVSEKNGKINLEYKNK